MKKIIIPAARSSMVDQLKRAVLSGSLPPEQELVQEELAAQLGASRTPVREALHHLEEEGYLRRLPNRHVKPVRFDSRARRENLSMLCAIEQQLLRSRADDRSWHTSLTAASAALRADPSEKAELSLHRSFSNQLENYYLQTLHLRVLDGHFAFLLEGIPPHDEAVSALLACGEAVLAGESEAACSHLNTYFTLMSACV